MWESNNPKKYIYLSTGMFVSIGGLCLPIITYLFFELENLYWSIPSALFTLIIGGHYLYYLEIDNEKITVKNLVFFWINKKFNKNQITDIRIYIHKGRNENGQTITTRWMLIKTEEQSKKFPLDYKDKYYIDLFYKLKKFNYNNNIFDDSTLTKKIIKKPNKEIYITYKDIQQKKFSIANNDRLTQNITTSKSNFIMFFGFGFSLLLLFLIIGIFNSGGFENLYKTLLSINYIFSIPISIGLYYLLLYFIGGKKEIVYNRKENTITYPISKFNKNTATIPFKYFEFYKILIDDSNHKSSHSLITIDKNNTNIISGVFNVYSGIHSIDFYSFIIWYMDKSRPLPPCEVFDLYRDIDYNNRKEKNFLKPLYSKKFRTPENTRKKQKERKLINNW